MRFMRKIYKRKAELGEDFGSDCLNWDLWDLGIFRIEDGRVEGERVGVGNPSYKRRRVEEGKSELETPPTRSRQQESRL